MDIKNIATKVQSAFDWIQDALSPIESRWITFIVVVSLMLIVKAGGAHGLALLIALIYIMYFVTFRQ